MILPILYLYICLYAQMRPSSILLCCQTTSGNDLARVLYIVASNNTHTRKLDNKNA